MAELADARDSKSRELRLVRVRPPSRHPYRRGERPATARSSNARPTDSNRVTSSSLRRTAALERPPAGPRPRGRPKSRPPRSPAAGRPPLPSQPSSSPPRRGRGARSRCRALWPRAGTRRRRSRAPGGEPLTSEQRLDGRRARADDVGVGHGVGGARGGLDPHRSRSVRSCPARSRVRLTTTRCDTPHGHHRLQMRVGLHAGPEDHEPRRVGAMCRVARPLTAPVRRAARADPSTSIRGAWVTGSNIA